MAAGDTIVAAVTPPGRGGVCIVRLSGDRALALAAQVTADLPPARRAALRELRIEGEPLDRALVLVFPGPRSFTGEDTVEFQLHGSPVVATLLVRGLVALGAREAGPGEFTRRAFLNGRLDLAQAEAIADLIASASAEAARAALRSLEGEFSGRVTALVEQLTQLRVRLEAGLDFPEEGVDDVDDPELAGLLDSLLRDLAAVRQAADRGRVLRDGLTLVIAGPPNAGKSSLLNRLAGYEAAIVTELPGTTRDLVREDILIDGMPVRVVDTAGLREAADRVEQEGIRRAREAMARADLVLLVEDGGAAAADSSPGGLPAGIPVLRVRNKTDLLGLPAGPETAADGAECLRLSALTGEGIDLLRERLRVFAGHGAGEGGSFAARRRHLAALDRATAATTRAVALSRAAHAPELAAEELRQAQDALGEITGRVTTEDLLGRIFSEFCIGK
ncbi:tRNA uridine-5-carboxymethylaminomethyl(34) synthesis GTPase MnmE [Thioalkalivibrio sp. XN279]|nr:tRNA uridine-5-carboxymethylaminomethyl(34) synthesis GTPase MnmE [Thioalkalivibrio sp. XN279]NHA15807.1 tRNA uridine-5-carboxymethylaminomethyl(34) synthesis GTPase MnmE [Thioalkalivibrio sp. XN279]